MAVWRGEAQFQNCSKEVRNEVLCSGRSVVEHVCMPCDIVFILRGAELPPGEKSRKPALVDKKC